MRGLKKYHEYISSWIRMVETGEVYTCKEEKLLMKFIRTVLDDDDVECRTEIVEDYVRITEKYFFPLMPDQKFYAFLILSLFYKSTGLLVFDQVFMMKGRGWGKNGFISSLAFFFTSRVYGVKKYHVHIVANSEEQAKTSFEDVYDVIVEMGEKGKRLYDYNLTRIKERKTLSKIEYKTSNAKTKDGGRPGAVIFDEVHAYTNYENIKVFTGGLGKVSFARRIYITTDGDVRDKVIDDYKKRSERILTGKEVHNGFLPIISKLDTIQEVGKKHLWEKANLRINYSLDLKKEIETEYQEMLGNEHLKEAFLTKRMNLPYMSKTKTVCSWEDLMFACQGHSWVDLTGKECHGSLDFADLRDFASAGLRWKFEGKTYFRQHSWIHEKALELREYDINVRECIEEGWATVVRSSDYPTIPPKLIAQWFAKNASEGVYITKIKCDSFRFGAIKEEFERYGLPEVVEIRSGSISHNKTAPVLDGMFSNREVVFEDDKLLRWYFWNVKREMDDKGNVTYKKIEPDRRKTDGFFCFLHNMIDDTLEEAKEMMFYDVKVF